MNSEHDAGFTESAIEHLDVLYRSALRLTRSPADADDLVQDTYVKACRFQHRYEEGTNLRAWLLRIQTNTFLNRYRRKQRERDAMEVAEDGPVGEGVVSRAAVQALTAPEETAERRLLAKEIERALDGLPPDYRALVVMADMEELSYREMAEVLDCPIGTVMSRLHRARRLMQGELMAQARAMGIVEPVASDEPIQLLAFQRKKAGKA